MPEAFATAYLNLFLEGGLKKGDILLMHAGASGLASVVIPMAKAFGAYVITTIIDENKREIVAKTGADLIVNTKKEDIVQILREFDAKGTPVNLTIDCLGGRDHGRVSALYGLHVQMDHDRDAGGRFHPHRYAKIVCAQCADRRKHAPFQAAAQEGGNFAETRGAKCGKKCPRAKSVQQFMPCCRSRKRKRRTPFCMKIKVQEKWY